MSDKLAASKIDMTSERDQLFTNMVRLLAKSGDTIKAELTGTEAHAWHMATGIAGEAGEIIDAIKKAAIYRKTIDLENLIEELGDIEFYLEGLRQAFNIHRDEVLLQNITKLTKRYGEALSYSDQAAQIRADKVV